MSYKVAEWVQESTTTTSTGTLSLGGAASGCQGIVAALGTGSTSTFLVTNRAYGGTAWEVFEGVVTDASPDTLTRDVVFASSNGGAAVDLPSGTKDVLLWVPVSRQIQQYVRFNSGNQTGFTNSLTDLQSMTFPVRTGEVWVLEGEFVFSCSGGTNGVAVQCVSGTGGIALNYRGSTTGATAYSQNVAKGTSELSSYYVTVASAGLIRVWGYVAPTYNGVVKFQGQSGGAGTTAVFGEGSFLKATLVPA